jgi:cytoskeletal protein RodZ
MLGFRTKSLETRPTLGDELKAWREKRKMSVAEVAEKSNLQAKYILALERNDYSEMPELLYAKNFLKSYLEVLGLKQSKFLATFDNEWQLAHKTQGPEIKKGKILKSPGLYQMLVTPQLLKIFLVSLAGIAIIFYLGWQIDLLLKPPVLELTYPPDDSITTKAQIQVKGSTDPEAIIEINNQEVITDSLGSFDHTLDLQRGLNIVTIKAWKRHSRSVTYYKKIILESN